MFRAVKSSYEFQVSLNGTSVRVKPMSQPQQDKGFLSRTLARCEEFLAQAFIQEHNSKDKLGNLIAFFRNRGWQVQL